MVDPCPGDVHYHVRTIFARSATCHRFARLHVSAKNVRAPNLTNPGFATSLIAPTPHLPPLSKNYLHSILHCFFLQAVDKSSFHGRVSLPRDRLLRAFRTADPQLWYTDSYDQNTEKVTT